MRQDKHKTRVSGQHRTVMKYVLVEHKCFIGFYQQGESKRSCTKFTYTCTSMKGYVKGAFELLVLHLEKKTVYNRRWTSPTVI